MADKLKAYYWRPHIDSDYVIAVVARNSKDAKKIGWKACGEEYGNDDGWTDQRCELNRSKNLNIDGLSEGAVLDVKEGLKRGLYGAALYETCEFCKSEGITISEVVDGKLCCDDCLPNNEASK